METFTGIESVRFYLKAVEAGIIAHDQLLVVLQRVDVAISHQHGAKGMSLCNRSQKQTMRNQAAV